MIIILLLILIFFIGAGVTITGLVLWGVFDIELGETLGRVGIGLMLLPIILGIIAGVILLILALFGLIVFI